MKTTMIRTLWITILSIAISIAGFSLSKAQGFEDFTNLDRAGSSYIDSSFVGNDGITWTYKQSRGDSEINGKALMLGRNRTPDAELVSSAVSGGVDSLSFSYKQAFSSNVNLNVYVNDVLVGNVTTSGEQNAIKSASLAVFTTEDAVIKFSNEESGAGQVVLDDISWGAYEGGIPVLTADVTELSGFSYTIDEGPSASQSFTVSGSDLPGSVNVSATGDFEISSNDTDFSSTFSVDADSTGAVDARPDAHRAR